MNESFFSELKELYKIAKNAPKPSTSNLEKVSAQTFSKKVVKISILIQKNIYLPIKLGVHDFYYYNLVIKMRL